MSKLLALEWDSREARLVVGSRRGDQVLVEHAFALELSPADAQSTFEQPLLADRLAAALEKLGVSRPETLLALGRTSIELRTFSLPPVPDDELPDLVRLQAPRHFSTIDDDWALDFFEIESGATDTRTVLAAAVAPETIAHIRQTCDKARLPMDTLVLRPCAAASLLKRRQTGNSGVALLVDLLADEVDLTVLAQETVVFTRTTRLPGEPGTEHRNTALAGEIRRTILAVRNQLEGNKVDSIVLCGDNTDYAAIETVVADQLKLAVERFDPFSVCKLSRALKKNLPVHRGRFAPLLGLLLDEAEGTKHAIDFLNPRKRGEPADKRRLYALAVAAAASLALLLGYFLWSHSMEIDDRLMALENESKRLERQLKTAAASQKDLAELLEWERGGLNWVAELAEQSQEFPPPSSAIVTQLRAGARRSGGGQLTLDGFAVDSSTVIAMERALRDARHEIYGSGSQEDEKRAKYRWGFSERIEISPAGDDTAAAPGTEGQR